MQPRKPGFVTSTAVTFCVERTAYLEAKMSGRDVPVYAESSEKDILQERLSRAPMLESTDLLGRTSARITTLVAPYAYCTQLVEHRAV